MSSFSFNYTDTFSLIPVFSRFVILCLLSSLTSFPVSSLSCCIGCYFNSQLETLVSHSLPVWALQVWSVLPLISPQTPSLSPRQPGVAPSAPSASRTDGRQADMKLQRLGVALTMNLPWPLHHHGSNHAAVMTCCRMDMLLAMTGEHPLQWQPLALKVQVRCLMKTLHRSLK